MLLIWLQVGCKALQSVGPTVFRGPRNFEPSRGIWPLPRNCRVSTEFCVNTEIPRQRPYSVSRYCCNNCDTQSLRTATQACWLNVARCPVRFAYLLKFLLTGPLYTKTTGESWYQSYQSLIWWYHIISLISLSDRYDWSVITSKFETFNFELMIDFTTNS